MKYSIFDEGCKFSFFQAVRVLERLHRDREPLGRDALPGREVVRLGARVSLEFPASEIQQVTRGGEASQPLMTVNFMGLTGPSGELPRHYTELLLNRLSNKDHTLREFLDLFNHRLISFFYRAWEKYRFPVAFERGGQDEFSQYLYDLIGMGTRGLRGRLAVYDIALLFYSGLFAQHPRSASALQGILRDYYQVPCAIEQFVGRWVPLGHENETLLAIQNSRLGRNAVLGSHIWDRQSKFRVMLGPLSIRRFRDLLPCGSGFRGLTQLIRLFAGEEYEFDIRLRLRADDVPACRLRSDGGPGAHLGWSSWLKTRDFSHDTEDTVLQSEWRGP
jgi:type VI secretion system protein ImpH